MYKLDVKYCQGITRKELGCRRRVNDKSDFCNTHNYKTEECSICFVTKEVYKLNCCTHYFCKTCQEKINKCALCRTNIKLTDKDTQKILTCQTILITTQELEKKMNETDNDDLIIYRKLRDAMLNELKNIAQKIYNKYYRENFKIFSKNKISQLH